ncbi:MAG: hybrid sensor histidine kinase/response regulator [Bacteroidales bacterium]|nr:hybrid sensor histidine kinase/response regulator [Bacteroidales bacterium]
MNKILIVDDNPKNIQVLGNILSERNYDIEYAQDGLEAIEMVKSENFDLILMDVMMPEMNGYDACISIKKLKDKADIPLIFLTAKTDEESIVYGFECGGADYVTKPFKTTELMARIETHLALKKSKDMLSDMNVVLEKKVEERTKELHVSNEKLKKANHELERMDEAKNQFLQIFSHEIRTPLNGMLGPLKLIQNKVDTKEINTLLNILQLSVNRLEKFSLTALLITELRAGKYKFNKEKVNLGEIMEFSFIKLRESITEKSIQVKMGEDLQAIYFTGDKDMMMKLFTGVIENAIKRCGKGDTVSITTSLNKNELECNISDTGKEFTKEELAKLLEDFETNDFFINPNYGLDLQLAKLIADAHNGTINISNNPDKGVTVCILLSLGFD